MAADQTPSGLADACVIADAILYEGYLLYPYRKSSGKNQVRWQFGVLAPRAWIDAHGGDTPTVAGSAESWYQQTECLVEATPDVPVRLRFRFLRTQAKVVESIETGGRFAPVDELDVGGRRYLTFEEAVPVETETSFCIGDLVDDVREVELRFLPTVYTEALVDQGRVAGRIVRKCQEIRAAAVVTAERASTPFPLLRLRLRIENRDHSLPAGVTRSEALAASLVATHTLIEAPGGAFLSLIDPPEWASSAARECTNLHAFPVLAGPTGNRQLVLSSPIILYDHPRVANQSPGDLFDATEIDEILSLRILTLSDQEKEEARATDERAAAIIDRVEDLSAGTFRDLHGVMRNGHRPTAVPAAAPWWDSGAAEQGSPITDTVVVAGQPIGKGSRVRLRPRPAGTDAHDMFLAGRVARVEAVLLDVDGAHHVAVTLEDDPGAELHQWYGRFHYFSPEEIELIAEVA